MLGILAKGLESVLWKRGERLAEMEERMQAIETQMELFARGIDGLCDVIRKDLAERRKIDSQ